MPSSVAGKRRRATASSSAQASPPDSARVGGGEDQQDAGGEPDGPEVDAGGVGGHEAPRPPLEGGLVGDVRFELPPPRPDQVVAHVRGAIVRGALLRRVPGALHHPQRHPELGLAGGLGEFLHRLPVAVAALEVHLAVRRGGVPPQDLLDEADALEEERPVQRRAEPEAGDRVAHRDLRGGLGLVFRPDHVFGGHPLGGEPLLHGRAHRRHQGAVLAHPLQEAYDERGLEGVGEGGHGAGGAGAGDLVEVAVGREARLAGCERLLRQAPQVLDQRDLEHAGPGPQLADGQGGHGLVGGHEPHQLHAIEAPVGVADQLQRHRVDARHARHFAGRQLGEPAVIPARQVVPHAAELRLDQVGVVEVPFGGGGEELAAVDVVRQDAIGVAEDPGVVVEAEEEGLGPAPGAAGQGEAGGEHAGPLLEALDAQQFGAERALTGGAARPEDTEEGVQGVDHVEVYPISGGGTFCHAGEGPRHSPTPGPPSVLTPAPRHERPHPLSPSPASGEGGRTCMNFGAPARLIDVDRRTGIGHLGRHAGNLPLRTRDPDVLARSRPTALPRPLRLIQGPNRNRARRVPERPPAAATLGNGAALG